MEFFDDAILDESQLKKVLIFASFAPSLLLFRAHLIQEFLEQGCQVSVLVPNSTITPEFKAKFTKRFPNVTILSIELSLHGLNPFRDFKAILELKRLFKIEKPNIILSYTIKPVIYGSIAAYWAKIPAIFAMITGLGTTFEVNSFKDKLIHRLVKVLYRNALKKCQKVIFQNPDDEALFIKFKLVSPRKTIRTNGSGVDLTHFAPAPLPQKIQFIFIGRLVIEKGIREFIEAAQRIHLSYPEVHFCIVGDIFAGHPRSVSAEWLQELKKEPYFDFVGHVDEVNSYIAKSSVMVLPSYREGTPRSVLEAMAMGRPIITTDAPGCRETVINRVNGFLVPIKNSEALYKAMEYFIKFPDKISIMGQESRKIALNKFDVHKVNQGILKAMGIENE